MPETVSLPHAGLFSRNCAPVALGGVTIDAEIVNLCARVTITQRYVNREATPIEAVYVFPLDEASAVCGFQAIVDGTLVVGEVKEREEAFRAYDEAMEEGHGAFLLDEERPDVFQASVGNLLPGKEVLLKLTYVSELSVSGGSIRFVVPTTVSPRYAPAEDRIGVGRPDSEALNPPVAWDVPYGLNLSVRLAMTGGIGRIESPSHPIAMTIDGGRAVVSLSQRDAALDQDFVLSVDADAMDNPQAWVETGEEGDDAMAVAFVPALPSGTAPAEVIFVVDRSGSMSGTSIEEVRNALQLCLRSLVAGCHFNIIGFGNSVDRLFPQSLPYDEDTLRRASAHVSDMEANLGGTEMLQALEAVFDQPRHPRMARQIVLLTDGQVTNTDAVLALAKAHADHARIFTFGIGAGASHHLVRGLARAGGGAAELIHPGERIASKVTRQLGRVLSPALTGVAVDWGGWQVRQSPSTLPAIFADGRLLVYGFVLTPREKRQPTTVRLTAESSTGPVAFEARVDPALTRRGRTVALLAARARIRELEEHPESLAARGSRQRERKASLYTREIVELSTKYGLMSRETSFVAIERRDAPVAGDVQLRRIPVALTRGWGDLDSQHPRPGVTFGAARSLMGARSPEFLTLSSSAWVPQEEPASSNTGTGWFSRRRFSKVAARVDLSPPPRHSQGSAMQRVIELQHADGSWTLTNELAAAIGSRLSELEHRLRTIGGESEAARSAWATALALAWLEAHAGDSAGEWRLLALKARGWLAGVAVQPADGRSWLDAARQA